MCPMLAAELADLAHRSVGIETVRVAQAALGCSVEFVLLDAERALVAAAVGPSTLQPRPRHAAECDIFDGKELSHRPGGTAVAVTLGSATPAALFAAAELDDDHTALLGGLARMLQANLESEAASRAVDPAQSDALLQGLRDVVLLLDTELRIDWCNDAIVTLLGWTPDEVTGRNAAELIHPDDIETALDAAVRLSGGHETYRVRLRLLSVDGTWIPVAVTGLDHRENPAIGGLLVSVRNDEGETETDRALDRSQRVSATILDNLSDAVIATDALKAITIINHAARRLFEIDLDRPAGSVTVEDLPLLDTDGRPIDPEWHPLLSQDDLDSLDLGVRTRGGMRHLSVSRRTVTGPGGDRLGTVLTFHDVTQARADAKRLQDRALHDQLTGLANRRYLGEQLWKVVNDESCEQVAALFIDLDKFKNVNDIHGHRTGDAVLRAAAARLRTQIRSGDILARPGGDEFVIILVSNEQAENADTVAERVRSVLSEPYDIGGNRLHLTASVGIVRQLRSELDPDRLLQNADIALYAAKDRGRDRVEFFDEELAKAAEVAQRQRSLVRETLDNDRLEMHFQPIVDLAGNTVGVEALARCRTESGELIEPAGFLEAIDGTSLLVRLDRRAFELGCRAAARLAERAPDRSIWVACNFSSTTLAQSELSATVLETISATGIRPDQICIEVTETAAFEAGPHSIAELTRLHRAGVRIALDDFGTGYSSLMHLRDLPLSTVKIDRTFTAALDSPGTERAIASAVRELAVSLGLSVVAEGVETEQQLEAARKLGLDTMQGWLYAKAMPLDEMCEVSDTPLVPTTSSS